MIENASVTSERQRQVQEYWNGLDDGYHGLTQPLPEWWMNTPVARLTVRQRGYFVGREIAMAELEEKEG